MRVGYGTMLLLLAIPVLFCIDFGSAECSEPLEEYGKLEARSRLVVGYKGFSTELECIFTRRHNSEVEIKAVRWGFRYLYANRYDFLIVRSLMWKNTVL